MPPGQPGSLSWQRSCTQIATEAKVRQPPYGQKNYQGRCKQSTRRKPCGRRKAHGVGSDSRCRSTKNLLNNVRALPQVGSDELTGEFEKDSDIRSAQRQTNQQREALPHSTEVKVVAAYNLGKSEARKTRARRLVRTETGKANNQTENFATQEPQRELRSE